MKIKDILEGVLGSLVRGMGTASGVPSEFLPTGGTSVQDKEEVELAKLAQAAKAPGAPESIKKAYQDRLAKHQQSKQQTQQPRQGGLASTNPAMNPNAPKQDSVERDKQPIPGFDVISNDPLIVRYDKIDYTLNDRGEWSRLVQGRREPAPMSQSLTRALDKVAGLVDSSDPTKPEPKTAKSELPDISQLSAQQREELKKRLKASLKVGV